MRNFNYPYFSRSIPEFWRRWHISFTTWFRDYLYFPLGGSRCDKWKIVRNVYIVWGISGLWHGADWTFVCWGLYHATLLVIYNLLGINTKYQNVVAYGHLLPNIKETFQIALTFFLFVISLIFVRAESMTQVFGYLSAMVTNKFFGSIPQNGITYLCFGLALLAVEWLQRDKQHALQFPNNRLFSKKVTRWALYIIIYLLILFNTGKSQTFFYFQF